MRVRPRPIQVREPLAGLSLSARGEAIADRVGDALAVAPRAAAKPLDLVVSAWTTFAPFARCETGRSALSKAAGAVLEPALLIGCYEVLCTAADTTCESTRHVGAASSHRGVKDLSFGRTVRAEFSQPALARPPKPNFSQCRHEPNPSPSPSGPRRSVRPAHTNAHACSPAHSSNFTFEERIAYYNILQAREHGDAPSRTAQAHARRARMPGR